MSNYNRGGGGRGGRRNGPATLPEEPPFTAFIGHLPQGIIQSDIEHIFEECGIAQVRMVYDKIDNKFKGYCYVEFNEQNGLVKALEFNGANIEGKTMKVDIAEQKRDNRGGRDGGGGRGGGRGGDRGGDLRGGDRGGDLRGGNRGGDGDRSRQNSNRGGGHGGNDNFNRGGNDNFRRGGNDNFNRQDSHGGRQDNYGGRGFDRGNSQNDGRRMNSSSGNQDYQNFQRGDRNSNSYSRQPSNSSYQGDSNRRRMGSHSSQGSHSNQHNPDNNSSSAFTEPNAVPAQQPQRRRLNLKARTKPVESADAAPVRNESIFGKGHARDETVAKKDGDSEAKSGGVDEVVDGVKSLSTNEK